jgi:hypothetical protein
MSSSQKTTKNFTLSKLRQDGANWILFQDGVELECGSHSLLNHIDGTKSEPVNPHAGVVSLSSEQQAEVDEYSRELEKWAAGEATIRKGLSEALPATLYLTVRKETTAKKVWDAVVKYRPKWEISIAAQPAWPEHSLSSFHRFHPFIQTLRQAAISVPALIMTRSLRILSLGSTLSSLQGFLFRILIKS